MKLRSMEEKISYRLFLMGFLGLLFTAALCIFVFHKAFTAQAWTGLEQEAELVSAGYEMTDQQPQELTHFVTEDLRITLISQDGSVLFESATDQPMENHLSRPEIKQAISDGVGKDIRDSQTMGYETYYYAVLLPTGEILRVAQDAETIWSIYDSSIPAIVLSCVALMMAAAILAGLLTKALVQPVLDMTEDLDHIQENVPYKELIPFAESIHSDRILRENNEKMRQEFTANVSHELKTPLTSISGYAELIETGIAKPEDVQGFAQKIHVEATRMLQLVNDILQLSKLDSASETGNTPAMEVVDLLDVAKECVERQKLNARRAYISLSYLGESAPVRGSRDLLDELCQNLCDNAIRYNRPGGKVQITTACSRDGHCTLTVADNGIGIPKEAQSSVFERFYRVDKSRSKATGGTGLGLAIVKHIARIHGARIKLESQVDEGTTITVTFPTAD
ncbi:ATP-binding protein [Faecalibacterium prausnitzii]|uniref:sensor histidine kinase n=1 Tax=Faecalibacterium prausnitzii TaxID=853 RepID=UPI0029125876|nr:ATP-binding protein [Faecalibacterium prausnitzii]